MILFCVVATGCYSDSNGCGDSDTDTNANVTITETTNYIQIEPVNETPTSCFIFYPGAMIEPADYNNPLQLIAAEGHRVLILKPFMNLAIMSVGLAAKAMDSFDDIDHWVIGGHSLGGVLRLKPF